MLLSHKDLYEKRFSNMYLTHTKLSSELNQALTSHDLQDEHNVMDCRFSF